MNVLGNTTGITQGLIDELQSLFPPTLPVVSITENELARLQGQQDVIRKIIALYEENLGEDT